jgi:cellulose synthase/poly-beta-1,6-N-acetylglucosamine synthase-like glycosyltransferase
MILTILLISITILYVVQMIALRIGLNRSDRSAVVEQYEPAVSVIVAARNEEECILTCLEALSKISYPKEKLDIVIVNDGSTDRTWEIVNTFIRQHPTIRMISTTPGTGNLRGKTNAVAKGIEASSGEIIMFTDADCTVPSSWVRETVKSFDEHVGIVGGFTLLRAGTVFEGIQSLDWVFLFGLASSTAGWKMPLTVIGNNFSVRRAAYLATGGYGVIPFSVTEDYALVQAVVTKTEYKVSFPLNPDAVVISNACKTWQHLYRQKQRWGVGGLDMVFRGLLITSVGWIERILLIAAMMTGTPFSVLFITLISLLLADYMFLEKPLRQFGKRTTLKYFPLFELYFSVYMLILPLVALLSKNVVWKERKL